MRKQEARKPHVDGGDADVMRHYEGALRRFFGRRVPDAAEVDDLVQEAFARLYETGDRRDLQSPVAYLFRIASNLVADRGRRLARQPEAAPIDTATDYLAVAPDQEHARMLADLQAALADALAGLSPRCREIFLMRRFQNLGTAEIAARMNITHRMVQKHMTRAMTHIFLCLQSSLAEVPRHGE